MKVKQKKTKQKVKLQIAAIIALIAIIAIIALLLVAMRLGFAKYIFNDPNEVKLYFYEYRIDPSEICLSTDEYAGEDITVTITSEETALGLLIQYKLGDSEEWIDYTEDFIVEENTKVEARLVVKDSEGALTFAGPVTEKNITNIAVAKIGSTYYKTLDAAIKACPENAGDNKTRIEMLANTTESVIVPEGKNIILDLCGNTVTFSEEEAITVNGKLNLIDSEEERKSRV